RSPLSATTVAISNCPLAASYGTVMQLLTSMREGAWRNAEALVNAPTPAARALVAQNIEDTATAFANTVILLQSASPLSPTSTRDAWCAVHKGDAAPMEYPFGMPSP